MNQADVLRLKVIQRRVKQFLDSKRKLRRFSYWTNSPLHRFPIRRHFSTFAGDAQQEFQKDTPSVGKTGRKRKTPDPTADKITAGINIDDVTRGGYDVASEEPIDDEIIVPSKLWTMGFGTHGALGHGSYTDQHKPKEVEWFRHLEIKSIASGWAHSLAVDHQGRLWKWGWIDDVKTIFTAVNF